MKKLHIDAILDPSATKVANNPGPGQHELCFNWIQPKDSLLNKTSPQFSFAKSTEDKSGHFGKQLKKASFLPGPGHYSSTFDGVQPSLSAVSKSNSKHRSLADDFNLMESSVGFQSQLEQTKLPMMHNSTMSKIGKSLSSTIRTDQGFGFAKARDRFHAPTSKKQSPCPQSYHIADSIGYEDNSINLFKMSNAMRVRFGNENRSRQFDKILQPLERSEVPGPGQYSHQTQFDNEIKFQLSVKHKNSLQKTPTVPSSD